MCGSECVLTRSWVALHGYCQRPLLAAHTQALLAGQLAVSLVTWREGGSPSEGWWWTLEMGLY